MKKCIYILLFSLLSNSVFASHIIGAEINVKHDSAFNYIVSLKLYRDTSGIPAPSSALLYILNRSLLSNYSNINLPLDSSSFLTVNTPTCQNIPVYLEEITYSGSVYFDPTLYNDPAGYYLTFLGCCGSAATFPSNIYTSPSPLSPITLMPPVVDSNGQPFVNSNPIVNSPIEQYACNQSVYSENFGGHDLDGDSIVYKLFTPLSNAMGNPTVTSTSFPFVDPTSNWQGVSWGPGYNIDNQINGYPGPAPSANRLKIDASSGQLTLIANESPGYYIYGIWTQEFRNGTLIGSIFRQFPMLVLNCGPFYNTEPQIQATPNQMCGSWNGDTLVFNSRFACTDIQITDSDSMSFLELELLQIPSLIDSFYFTADTATINFNGIFYSRIHFTQDSFDSQIRELKVLVNNPHCSGLQTDTLNIPYQFINYSNAGIGGRIAFAINLNQPHIDLFDLLGGNPNPGGAWIDVDNSSLLNVNNQFVAQNVLTPSTYRFQYIDQQPNYPADSAEIELEFFIAQGLDDLDSEVVIVYPNPVKDIINVSSNTEESVFEIYDIHGRLMKSVELKNGNNTIRTDTFHDGLFFYQYQNQRGKFLIQH